MKPRELDLLRVPGAPTISPDGSWAVFAIVGPDLETDEYVGQLWIAPTDGSAPPRRLTQGFRDGAPTFSPDGGRIAFVRAAKGGKPQVHIVPVAGGEAVVVTEAKLGASTPVWSPDGSSLAFLARVPEEGRFNDDVPPGHEPARHITSFNYRGNGVGFTADKRQHLFVLDVPAELVSSDALPQARQLTEGDIDVDSPAWLPDGEHVVLVSSVHDDRDIDLCSDVIAVPRVGGPVRALTDASRAVGVVATGSDGSVWFIAQDMGPGRRDFVGTNSAVYSLRPTAVAAALAAVDGATLPQPVLHTDPEPSRPVEAQSCLAVVGPSVYVVDERRGANELVRLDPASGSWETEAGQHAHRTILIPTPAVVNGIAVGADGQRIVASVTTPESPGEIVSLDVASGVLTTLTAIGEAYARASMIYVPRELEVIGRDGYPIHGWVVAPNTPGPHPVLLNIHGGPYTQYVGAFFDEAQVYVEAGYAVVMCNPRGGSGYGQAHGRSIKGAMGTLDANDVLDFLDGALADERFALDANRVGVMGGSYGGYMTAWLTTQTDRFAAAIVERGFLDPVSFLGSSDIGWFFGLEYCGTDADAVAAQSPMANIDNVTTPTMVIHSEQDWRCPVEQGQRWFVELKRRGVPVEFLLFPGENHELSRSGTPKHRAERFEYILGFWEKYLPVS